MKGNVYKISENVYRIEEDIGVLRKKDLEVLKDTAKGNKLQRARINFHRTDNELVHEMIIAMTNKTEIEPHYHNQKTESFHIIEGIVRIAFLERKSLGIKKIIELKRNHIEYYRLNESICHIVVPLTEVAVIHEVTSGPFIEGKSTKRIKLDKKSFADIVQAVVKGKIDERLQ